MDVERKAANVVRAIEALRWRDPQKLLQPIGAAAIVRAFLREARAEGAREMREMALAIACPFHLSIQRDHSAACEAIRTLPIGEEEQ